MLHEQSLLCNPIKDDFWTLILFVNCNRIVLQKKTTLIPVKRHHIRFRALNVLFGYSCQITKDFEVRRNLFIAWILYKETLMDFLVNILD